MKKRLLFATALAAMMYSTQVQAQITFTVNEDANGKVLRTTVRSAEAAGDIKVPYHKYNLGDDGVLYTKGVTSKEFNATVTVAGDGDVVTISGYSDSKKANVVFYTEGEEIEGVTYSEHANVLIRASNSSTAFAPTDLTVTNLPAGKYRMTVGCFDTAKAGNTAVFPFSVGGEEFEVTSNGNNLSEVSHDFMIFSSSDLVWKASGSETKSIDYIYIQYMGEATTEVKQCNYTVNAVDEGGNVIETLATGTVEEQTMVKVAYSKYILQNGNLLMANVTNKEYNYSFEVLNENQVENITYKATDLTNVVFYAEGEDIEGLTPCTSANTAIRSSRSGSAYAAEDTKIAHLAPGNYQLYAIIYDSGKTPDSYWSFTIDGTEVANFNCTTVNIQELGPAEFSVTAETDLVMAKAGSNDRGLDAFYIISTDGAVTTGIAEVKAQAADEAVYNLAGQRVNNAQKGIFIQNGKKVVK